MKQSLLVLVALCGTAAAQPVMQPTTYDGPPSECPPSPPPAPVARVAAAAPAPVADEPRQWLVLGAITDEHGTLYGGRAQVDVFTHGAWSLGLAGTYRSSATTTDATTRSNATVYLAGTTSVGPLLVRAQLGVGEAFVDGASSMSIGGTSMTEIAEGALLVALPIASQWMLLGGPVVDVASAQASSVTAFAGLGRRF